MADVPRHEHFERMYAGQPPWEIGRPHRAFVEIADQVSGTLIDVGCGTGENALFFAARGVQVLGVDFVEAAIQRARDKAAACGSAAEFLVHDALRLAELGRTFDQGFDSGLFHVFDDADRARYVEQLARVVRPGGRLYLSCFSDAEPTGDGPRRVSAAEIQAAFSNGWIVESIRLTRYEVIPDLKDMTFSPGGPHAWFCSIRRRDSAKT